MMRTSAIAMAVLLNAGCAGLDSASGTASVPDTLKPAPGEKLAFITPAEGVQIYECRASDKQPGRYEWAFVAPDAELYDARGAHIGRHYAGPHWEAADGSRVVAAVKAKADAPRADAIPWLLLSARSVGTEGSFSKVTSIQRVNTAGGLAPRDGCSNATAGTPARVPYKAHYYFFTAQQ